MIRPRVEWLEDRLVLSTITAGGLEFSSSGGFTSSGSTQSATGEVQVGFTPGNSQTFQPLLELDGGVAVNTTTLAFTTTGSISSLISGTPTVLLQGPVSLNIGSLVGAGVAGLGGSSLSVAGTTFTLDSVALNASGPGGGPAIEVQGSIALPGGLTVGVDGPNDVVINAAGISLTGVDASVAGSLSLGGETFASGNLDANYTTATNTFNLTGTTSFALGGNSVAVTFGTTSDPLGLVIQNGAVTGLGMAVTSNLSIGGLAFATNGLTGSYDPGDGQLTIDGGASLSELGNTIAVTFGGGSTGGLVVTQGQVSSLGMTINSNFSIQGLGFTANQLTMTYASSTSTFTMAGTAGLSLGGSNLTATFGTGTGQGLVITNGTLTSLDVSASGTFSMLGLTVTATNLQAQYDTSANVYRFGGQVAVSSSAQADGTASFTALNGVSATLGSAQAIQQGLPADGLVISNGQVTEFNLQLDGSINLFGLGLSFNDLALGYNAQAGSLVVSGGASLAFGPFGGIAVTVPTSGLTISTTTGAVHVSGLTIAFSTGLGGGGSKQFGFQGAFSFSDTGSGSQEVQTYAASGTVSTGEGNFSGSIAMTHSGGHVTVNSVSVSYAQGASQGIEIDGLFITSISASITNIGTSQETIAGSIGADYGGSVGGVSLLTLSGQFDWTESALTGSLGYQLSTGAFASSSGMADLDLNFASETYGVELIGTAFANIFTFDLSFQINTNLTLDLSGTASLNTSALPSWVSGFLGSNNLPSLGFAFQYVPNNNASSDGAAWLTIAGQEVGIEVNFNGNVTEIVSGGLAQAFQALSYDSTQVYDESASALASAYSAAAKSLGSGLATTASQFQAFEQSTANNATAAFNNAVNGAVSTYNSAAQYAQSSYNSLVGQAASYFNTDATSNGINQANQDYQAALSNAQSTYHYYINYASTQYSSTVAQATSVYQSASPVIINAGTQVVAAATTELSSLNSAASSQLSLLESSANNALGSLQNTANQAIQAIANAAAAAAAAAKSAAAAAAAAAASAAKSVKRWFSHLGYLSGAVVYYDASGKGVLKAGESYVVTASDGSFKPILPKNPSKGDLIVLGGVDTSTGLPNLSFAMAPGDSTFISPMTTLVALVEKGHKGMSEKAANAMVDRALGLSTSVNLEQEDLIKLGKAGNMDAAKGFAAEIRVSVLEHMIDGLLVGAAGAPESATISQDVFQVLANAIGRKETVADLANPAAVTNLLTNSAKAADVTIRPGVTPAVADLITGLYRQISASPVVANEASLDGLLKAQVVADATLASALTQVEDGQVTVEQLLANESPAKILAQVEAAQVGTLSPDRPEAAPSVMAGTTTDLALTSTSPANSPAIGQPSVFSFTVTNRGEDTAVGVTMSLDLSGLADSTIMAVAPSQGSIAPEPGSVGVDRVDLGSLAAGGSASVSIVVLPRTPGHLIATATTSSLQFDTDPSDNSAEATVSIAPTTAKVSNRSRKG